MTKSKRVFVAGCFDGLHDGHLFLLKECKKLGELHVAINEDEDVKRRKGNNRPIYSNQVRMENLYKSGADFVHVFNGNDDLKKLISNLRPDYIVTGRQDYKLEEVVGYDICGQWGGTVINIPQSLGVSTTSKLTPNIHITGGAGFIGSNLVRYLNSFGIRPVIYDRLDNWKNLAGLDFKYGGKYCYEGSGILVHLGAKVDTTEVMSDDLWHNNVEHSLDLIKEWDGKIIYASSGAVYGNEEKDFTERIDGLKPMNAYAFTKWYLDRELFQIRSIKKPVYGLRFFNVYGPNEDHKGTMRSIVHRFVKKVAPLYIDNGVQLDKFGDKFWDRYWSIFADGKQARDCVHVEDVCSVIKFFIDNEPTSGIYNVGTGEATDFNTLAKLVQPNMDIKYSPLPDNLKDQYQFYTKADISKLRAAGYDKEFIKVEEGIKKL